MATLPGAWRYRVSAGTGRPGVSILWLGEVESWICNFYLSVAARKIVWADPSLRYTSLLLGLQPTNKQQHPPSRWPQGQGDIYCWLLAYSTSQHHCWCISLTDLLWQLHMFHTETEVAGQIIYLTQSQWTDTGQTSPSADPIRQLDWQGNSLEYQFWRSWCDSTRKNLHGEIGTRAQVWRSCDGLLSARSSRWCAHTDRKTLSGKQRGGNARCSSQKKKTMA